MRYIAVNYHYIRKQKLSGLNPCLEEVFLRQLDFLRNNYEMVGLESAYLAAKANKPGKFCALTFDDGLREHYEFAYPALRSRGISGTFFLMGNTLEEKRVPLTHKLHLLLNLLSVEVLRDEFHKFFGGKYRIEDKERLNPKRRFDDVLTANLKETLIALGLSERRAFLDYVFGAHFNEKETAGRLFMDPDEAKKMSDGGMEIGAHGYEHLSLETLNFSEQKKDIELGIAAIQNAIGKSPKIFSYPHGRYTKETADILKENGFDYAVTIKTGDIKDSPGQFSIMRYDTNDIQIL